MELNAIYEFICDRLTRYEILYEVICEEIDKQNSNTNADEIQNKVDDDPRKISIIKLETAIHELKLMKSACEALKKSANPQINNLIS